MTDSWRHGRPVANWPWWRRPWNREWWQARPFSMFNASSKFTKWFKRATHKRERLAAKEEIRRALDREGNDDH